jgi:inner membrane protein
MDNLTHSVVGLGIGALIDRSVPPEVAPETEAGAQRVRTRLLLTIACVASNVPDLDLMLTRLLEKPLGYLLHHRGHTHTVLGGLGEIVLLLGLVWLLWPSARRLLRTSRRARLAAAGAACVGVLLHIAMDGLNVYGVHPFWPFDTRWYYGDLVFIVEPRVPPRIFITIRRFARTYKEVYRRKICYI